MNARRFALALMAALVGGIAAVDQVQAEAPAPAVWRCGPEGRTYSDAPCADGRTVDVADPRSASQVRDAQAIAAGERRLGAELAAQRLQREREAAARIVAERQAAAAPRALASASAPVKQGPTARRKVKRPPPEDDGIWRAVAPATPRKTG